MPTEYTGSLLAQGLTQDAAEGVTAMFAMLARGLLAGTSDDVATVLGRAPRTFEDYVVRAAAADAWRR